MPLETAEARNKRHHREVKEDWLRVYKLSRGCSRCGYHKCAGALHFHHRGSSERMKRRNRQKRKAIIHLGWTPMLLEMAKCELLCANCHAEKTWRAT